MRPASAAALGAKSRGTSAVKARDLREIFEGMDREGWIRVEHCPVATGGYPTRIAYPASPAGLAPRAGAE